MRKHTGSILRLARKRCPGRGSQDWGGGDRVRVRAELGGDDLRRGAEQRFQLATGAQRMKDIPQNVDHFSR